MLREHSHTKSESLAQIVAAFAEIQNFSPEDCFYWCTLYMFWYAHLRPILLHDVQALFTTNSGFAISHSSEAIA